jgi:hypothetical protein
MPDYNSNIIKPVENLQNIPGLVPAKDREQKKRRQAQEENKEKLQQEPGKSADEQKARKKITKNDNGRDAIDYCA